MAEFAELNNKPDLDESLRRLTAWLSQEVIDRPPIRFTGHNVYQTAKFRPTDAWKTLKDRWFDTEYQVDSFLKSIEGKSFLGETFPVFVPNLGPEVYAAFYGCDLLFQEITSYCMPRIKQWSDMEQLSWSPENEYCSKLREITDVALEKCDGSYWVGYPDLHPGGDCAAAWRDPQQFCMDMLLAPEECETLMARASADFLEIYDYFAKPLAARNQPSISWMGIPFPDNMHIPSCDFASLVSEKLFRKFLLPPIVQEIRSMQYNIFHLDGVGVARHLDALLELPEIHAIQWVQGFGKHQPILQWVPMIKSIVRSGKSVLLEIAPEELEPLMQEISPEGIMLSVEAPENIQKDLLQMLKRWTMS